VTWQDPHVEHVRIGHDDRGLSPQARPSAGEGITIIDTEAQFSQPGARHQRCQCPGLILCQSTGREEVQRPGQGILSDRLQHRDVVAQRFAAGCTCSDHDVFATPDGIDGFCLVRI